MTMRTTSENGECADRVRAGAAGLPESLPGVRPARAPRRSAPVRPGGRRSGSPLPVVRPAVGSGRTRPVDARAMPVAAVFRRRRVAALAVAAVLAALVVLGALAAVPGLAGGAQATPVSGPTVVAVVGEGESLQDVARRVVPGGNEREVADLVRELNGLASSSVQPGRPLVVPLP